MVVIALLLFVMLALGHGILLRRYRFRFTGTSTFLMLITAAELNTTMWLMAPWPTASVVIAILLGPIWATASSPLTMLNFWALQWLGIRLEREQSAVPGGEYWLLDVNADAGAASGLLPGRKIIVTAPAPRWVARRWIWPLTGWWTATRYIARHR